MQIINNVSSTTFTINGLKYVKNFIVIKQGSNNIAIHNYFDTNFQLMPSTPFNQVQVNGIIYSSQIQLMSVLAPLLFVKEGGGDVESVNGKTGAVVLSKNDLGLSNVDNTSDIDKPVSIAQSTAIASAHLWEIGTGLQAIKSKNSANIASGNYSFASGANTRAFGNYSRAEGFNGIASGQSSHVEGQNGFATGLASHSEGWGNIAFGNYSHAQGFETRANGQASHAEGTQTTADTQSAHSEGYRTQANGQNAHAQNDQTRAVGSGSHAEGDRTLAFGNYSHSQGIITEAIGQGSHAEGVSTKAYGDFSHTQGNTTVASGLASHASGIVSRAIGDYSFVHGSASTANGIGTIVLGSNITGNTDNMVYVNRLNVKNLSGGTSVSNLGIDASGNVVVGTAGGSGSTGITNSGTTGILPVTLSGGNLGNSIIKQSGNTVSIGGLQLSSIVTGFEDDTLYPFTTSLSPWVIENTVVYSGGSSISSGNLIPGQQNAVLWINTGITTVNVTFWYKVNSVSGDNFDITVDGAFELSPVSGNIDWTEITFSVPAGADFECLFSINFSSTTDGFAYIDNLSISNITTYDGTVQAGKFVKFGGTSSEYLMADGSVSTGSGSELWIAGDGSDSVVQNGSNSVADNFNATAIGVATQAIGEGAFAGGYETQANGDFSIAMGIQTQANGRGSHTEGYLNIAEGEYSHAEGTANVANGAQAHVEGVNTVANGNSSHAQGSGTIAEGNYSHAGGLETQANGANSFVHGHLSVAQADNTIVLGRNITGTTADTTYVDHLNIKTIGSGTSVSNLGFDSLGNVVSGSTGGGSGISNSSVIGVIPITSDGSGNLSGSNISVLANKTVVLGQIIEETIVLDQGFESGIISPLVSTGATPWFIQSAITYNGNYALRSGAISDNGVTDATYSITTTYNCYLTFRYYVEAENGSDYFRFLTGGNEQFRTSNTFGSWEQYTYYMDAGFTYNFTFRFNKDGATSTGIDAAIIDDLKVIQPEIYNGDAFKAGNVSGQTMFFQDENQYQTVETNASGGLQVLRNSNDSVEALYVNGSNAGINVVAGGTALRTQSNGNYGIDLNLSNYVFGGQRGIRIQSSATASDSFAQEIRHTSAGNGLKINNTTAGTGIPFQVMKNDVMKARILDSGIIEGTAMVTTQSAPTQGVTSGTAGQIIATSSYIYVCAGGTTWTRATLNTY